MPYQHKKSFIPNRFYHIYNRGNRRDRIYIDQCDYYRFISLKNRFLKGSNLTIYAYCLMPNHFHLLLNSGTSPSQITPFMHRFMTAYSVYFNKKYHFVGRLLQGPYKRRLIRNKEDFDRTREYIRQNPVKANIVSNPECYKWLYDSIPLHSFTKLEPEKSYHTRQILTGTQL